MYLFYFVVWKQKKTQKDKDNPLVEGNTYAQ